MGALTVDVKWQKETFKGIEIDTSESPAVFKSQLFSLTGVEPDRQKIMVKGGLLKDDTSWAKAGIKSGQRLMMMGSADIVPVAPKTAQVFIEDLPESEQDVTGLAKYGAGLENLGNTCYMNSTLQCFYGVEELRGALTRADSSSISGNVDMTNRRLAVATGQLFTQMERLTQPVPPQMFWLLLRQAFPQFDQQVSRQPDNMTAQRAFAQQDAEECWTNLMTSLRSSLKDPSASGASVIDQLFGVKFHTSLKCEEGAEVIEEDTSAFSLKCNISIDVNDLTDGIKLALQDDREKQSEALGRSAVYTGVSKITTLPPYLTVQMVRFFFKADVRKKAKILRKVTFPSTLDTYEFVSDELKEQLKGARSCELATDEAAEQVTKRQKRDEQAKRDAEEAAAKAKKSARAGDLGTADSAAASSTPAANADVDMTNPEEAVEAAAQLRKQFVGQPTGRYELTAVLTHKGRTADSGHYVAWVKQSDGTWVQFDDEQLIVRKPEEVLALSGGGDWHMAYLLLYKACLVQA